MHVDDSVESIADSVSEDGESENFEETDAMVMQDREVNGQYTEADRKDSLR